MTDAQTKSWIFLAIAIGSQQEPINFSQIFMFADGINHTIPNHKELQYSITCLKRKKLIFQIGRKYSLSDFGKETFEKNRTKQALLGIWKNLESELVEIE